MPNELKPCPFCGGEAKLGGKNETYQAWCEHCSAIQMGTFFSTPEEAIAAWNRRTEEGA